MIAIFLVPRIVTQHTFMNWMNEVWVPGSWSQRFWFSRLGMEPRNLYFSKHSRCFWCLCSVVLKIIALHNLFASATPMALLSICYYKLSIWESLCPVLIPCLSSRLVYLVVSWTSPFDCHTALQIQHDQSKNNFFLEMCFSFWILFFCSRCHLVA